MMQSDTNRRPPGRGESGGGLRPAHEAKPTRRSALPRPALRARTRRAGGTSAAVGVTFTVDSTADAPDANAGNGVCAAATGACTLRAAIQESNASTGLEGQDRVLPYDSSLLDFTRHGAAKYHRSSRNRRDHPARLRRQADRRDFAATRLPHWKQWASAPCRRKRQCAVSSSTASASDHDRIERRRRSMRFASSATTSAPTSPAPAPPQGTKASTYRRAVITSSAAPSKSTGT